MSELFLAADYHFGHAGVIKFTDSDGNRYRPFESLTEMHETIIHKHNSIVGKNDTTYVLGDICFNKKFLPLLNEMNGRKKLILGNHDCLDIREYLKYFSEISSGMKKHDIFLSHIPIHPSQLDSRWVGNAHGHLHANKVLHKSGAEDTRYYNVSMEVTDCYPVPFETIKSIIKQQR